MDFKQGLNFNGYINKLTDEQREKYIATYNRTEISDENKKHVSNINKEINLVVFSEGFCPDCTVALPFVQRMQELNSNIKVNIFERKGNESIMEEYTGNSRIPTVMSFSENMDPKGVYVELPQEVSEILAKTPYEKQRELIAEFRTGKYNDLVEKELVKIIK